MKLLIITQKLNKKDDVLGFFHAWVAMFSKYFKEVIVICLEKGEYDLPKNVRVLSLGKEDGRSRLSYVFRFYKYIWQERKDYDKVFVHMNPIYIVLGGPIWKIWGKQILLWYTHKQVDFKLRVAEKFSDHIFTSIKESFTLTTKKLHVVGHGIEVNKFLCEPKTTDRPSSILHMGRITRIKNCNVLIEAVSLLKKHFGGIHLIFAGTLITKDDFAYKQELETLIEKYGLTNDIEFVSISYDNIKDRFCQSDLSVNLTPTGGMDKAVLSSLVAKRPVFVSNAGFSKLFGQYQDLFIFKYCNPNDLAKKIIEYYSLSNKSSIMEDLSKNTRDDFSVESVVSKIIKICK